MIFVVYLWSLFVVSLASAEEVIPDLHVNHRGFADDLTSALYSTGKDNNNECTSSLGVSMAFSLVYPSMRPSSGSISEVQSVLGFPDENSAQLVWNDTTTQLNAMYNGTCLDTECNQEEPTLVISNSVWVTNTSALNQEYADVVNDLLFAIDFGDDSARDQVNAWVNEASRGLVEEIVGDSGPLTPLILLALNSIYLKANWALPFQAFKTNTDAFYTEIGKNTLTRDNALFMHQVEYLPYSDTALPGFQVVQLPFIGNSLSMLIVLPTSDVSGRISSTSLIDAIPDLETKRIALALPKFKFESTYQDNLKASLQALGLNAPFAAGDLCIYENDCSAFIEFIIQKTVISVDEEGVEAAAVTGIMGVTGIPTDRPTLFLADHPFQFFIYDKTTELVLFEGRVVDPVAPQDAPAAAVTARHRDDEGFWTTVWGIESPFVIEGGPISLPTPPTTSPATNTAPSAAPPTSSSAPTSAAPQRQGVAALMTTTGLLLSSILLGLLY